MKKKKVKTHIFNGHKYDIDVDEPFDACCDSPREKDPTPTLRVAVDINVRQGLIALLHECLHAEGWAVSEEVIDRTATEIGNLLWRLGYRRIKS